MNFDTIPAPVPENPEQEAIPTEEEIAADPQYHAAQVFGDPGVPVENVQMHFAQQREAAAQAAEDRAGAERHMAEVMKPFRTMERMVRLPLGAEIMVPVDAAEGALQMEEGMVLEPGTEANLLTDDGPATLRTYRVTSPGLIEGPVKLTMEDTAPPRPMRVLVG